MGRVVSWYSSWYCLESKRGCSKGSDQILSKMCMGLHSFSSKHKGQQEEVVLQ
jgi:hypothetical protein